MTTPLLLTGPKPEDTGRDLFHKLQAAKKAYEEKKMYHTYLEVTICQREYDAYYANKRRAIHLLTGE